MNKFNFSQGEKVICIENEGMMGDTVLCVKSCCEELLGKCVMEGKIYTIVAEDDEQYFIKELLNEAHLKCLFIPATPENIQKYEFSDRLEDIIK